MSSSSYATKFKSYLEKWRLFTLIHVYGFIFGFYITYQIKIGREKWALKLSLLYLFIFWRYYFAWQHICWVHVQKFMYIKASKLVVKEHSLRKVWKCWYEIVSWSLVFLSFETWSFMWTKSDFFFPKFPKLSQCFFVYN